MDLHSSLFSTKVDISHVRPPQILKFAVIGAANVGKTSFCTKFLLDYLSTEKLERLDDVVRRMVIFDDFRYEVELIDTQQEYFQLTQQLKVNGYIFLYTDLQSFKYVCSKREQLYKYHGINLPAIVVRNNKSSISNLLGISAHSQLERTWSVRHYDVTLEQETQDNLDHLMLQLVRKVHFQEHKFDNQSIICTPFLHQRLGRVNRAKVFVPFLIIHMLLSLVNIGFVIEKAVDDPASTLDQVGNVLIFSLLAIGVIQLIAGIFVIVALRTVNISLFASFLCLIMTSIILQGFSFFLPIIMYSILPSSGRDASVITTTVQKVDDYSYHYYWLGLSLIDSLAMLISGMRLRKTLKYYDDN